MNPSLLTTQLLKNLSVFRTLFNSISEEQIRWKPEPEKWSVLEVAHHLLDEEKEDFKKRIQYTLESPQKQWAEINPQQWVIDRAYNNQNFNEIIKKFYKERENSIKWLQGLKSANWENIYIHPKIKEISAGDLLASWIAHDFLHLRQIINLNLEFFKKKSEPFQTNYALP